MINRKSDPSGVLQHFSELRLKIHCCRYWKLSSWNLHNMISPFWRFYHNIVDGACVFFNQKEFILSKNRVILIPPNTAFSTRFAKGKKHGHIDILEGSRISKTDDLNDIEQHNKFDHFFIHFNLGLQYDNIKPNVYGYGINEHISSQLETIKHTLVNEYEHFSFKQTATIQTLILNFISQIPQKDFRYENYDPRVVQVLSYIERGFHLNLSNKDLAEQVAMSPNSFLRLFRSNTGQPLHNYLQKRRIEEAIALMHHTGKSIDHIASSCGFCDRYHFSKAFKKQMKVSPAYYRKQLTMK